MKKSCGGLVGMGLLLAFSAVGEVRLLTGDANNSFHNNDGFLQDVSPDGKLVLFVSGPPSSGSTPGFTVTGLYLRNLGANTLAFTGATNVGGEASMSDDGRYVAWASPANLIYWRDVQAGVTRLITPSADGACRRPILSADGRYAAYTSVARNLTANTNLLPAVGRAAVYLYDSQSQTTTVASLTYDGKALTTGVGSSVPQAEFDFSANGQYVFFSSDATNVHPLRATAFAQSLFWIYRRNLTNGTVDVVCKNATNGIPFGTFSWPATDATGNRVVFAGSFIGVFGGPLMISNYVANSGADLYLKDLTTSEVWWVSKTTNGTISSANFLAGGTVISGDGKVVAFASDGAKFVLENTDPPSGASDPFDIFRADIGPGGSVTNSLITKAVFGADNLGILAAPQISSNGNYITVTTQNHYSLVGSGSVQSLYYQGFGVGTLPAAAITPPPLKFTGSPGSFAISWPNTAGVNLYFKTNLTDMLWNLVTNVPVLAGGTNTVTLTATNSMRFFVLRSP